MDKDAKKIAFMRAQGLIRMARALYESACHEQDHNYLEGHRLVAVQLGALLDDAHEKDRIIHPDLGLHLILFIEHKAEASTEVETMREWALESLESSEQSITNIVLSN